MGCDYYIEKGLSILLQNNKCLWIILERNKGYFMHDYFDEDEDGYEEKMKKDIEEYLTPKMNPIVLYEENEFLKEVFKVKYYRMIEECILQHNYTWKDVLSVKKVEERYERS